MAKITYVTFDGERRTIEVKEALSVMEGAIHNNVPGIDAECGGACACATCHVYVDAAWLDKTGPASEMERNVLEFANGVAPNSRLSCQIRVTKDLEGLIVQTPKSQQSAL
jgi:ferredoxin, 2Fe-2S